MAEAKKKKKHKLISANDIFSEDQEILKISPAVDLAIGGGIPKGSWVILSGPPKSGKSTLAVHMIKKFITQFNGKCLFVDVENRLKKIQLSQNGLQLDDIEVLRSQENDILMAEDYLEETFQFIKNNSHSIVVIDSTSALCSTKEYTDDISGQTRSLGPKLLANFCRKLAPIVPVQNCIVVLITHIIANTSGYGSPYQSDSGNKIQFQSDVNLLSRKPKPWIEDGKVIGQENCWKTIWTALGGPPGTDITSYLRYNYGIDETKELVDIAEELGLIDKAGSWFTLAFMSETTEKFQRKRTDQEDLTKAFKFQGKDKVLNFIKNDQEVFDLLYKIISEMIYGIPVEE